MPKLGICFYYVERFSACRFYQFYIFKRFHADVRDAPLFAARKFAGAALHQVLLGQLEPIFCRYQGFESCECMFSAAFGADKTVCLVVGAYHAPAQLVQLG